MAAIRAPRFPAVSRGASTGRLGEALRGSLISVDCMATARTCRTSCMTFSAWSRASSTNARRRSSQAMPFAIRACRFRSVPAPSCHRRGHLGHVHTYGVLDAATKTGDDHADQAPTVW